MTKRAKLKKSSQKQSPPPATSATGGPNHVNEKEMKKKKKIFEKNKGLLGIKRADIQKQKDIANELIRAAALNAVGGVNENIDIENENETVNDKDDKQAPSSSSFLEKALGLGYYVNE